jgi:hypothetical protein
MGTKNPVAKDLRTTKFRVRVVRPRNGEGPIGARAFPLRSAERLPRVDGH